VIGWLLDTNVVASLISQNGARVVRGWFDTQPAAITFLSVLTLGEYDAGIHNLDEAHPERSRYIASRDALEVEYAGRWLSVTDAVVRRWGATNGRVRRQTGHPPQVVDTLLAATAIEHDLFFVTRNVRDVAHSGAAIFNPWTDDPAQFPIVSRFSARRRPPPA
jgi:predicted nucleic acid-binding protein